MKKKILIYTSGTLLVVMLCVVLFSGVLKKKLDTWDMFYYPEGCLHCQSETIIKRGYDSLLACKAATTDTLAARLGSVGVIANTDLWECGLNCKPYSDGLSICEETVD